MFSSRSQSFRATFSDRLLTEAVRVYEEDGAQPIDDPLADLAAQSSSGDFETKLILRARSLQIVGDLRTALRSLRSTIAWIVMLGMVIAFLIGAATARATLGTATGAEGSVVNFYWVLGGVLGVQTIALLVWLIVMIVEWLRHSRSPRRQPPVEVRPTPTPTPASLISFGAAVMGGTRWLLSKLPGSRDPYNAAMFAAAMRAYSAGPIDRWTFSAITHGIWLAFNIGCIIFIVLLLTARHYTFVWETTILRNEQYITITRGIAALPDWLGIMTPDREQIRNSQWPPPPDATAPPEQAREAWSGLLVGAMVVYGFGPRILLLGFSLGKRRTARQRYRLDTSQPGYARLESHLAPRTVSIGKVSWDGDRVGERIETGITPPARRPTSTSHAILGLEIKRPAVNDGYWPPKVHGVYWEDLGIVEGRDDQRVALDRLATSQTEPLALVIVAALTSTPDRGMARFLTEARSRLTQPVMVLLTGGQALRDRGYAAEDVAQRVQDWRELAARAGIGEQHILELDLDHLTDDGRARLKRFLAGTGEEATGHTRRIEEAFRTIAERASHWAQQSSPPSLEDQAELHRDIAKLHQSEQHSWRMLLNVPSTLSGLTAEDFTKRLRDGAARVRSLLPDRLLRNPKWMAAGALTGALGCVAAAALISPVAIGALPMWSGIGATIAAIWQPSARAETEEAGETGTAAPGMGDAVRSAALFAMLLELQGRDEATITHILDEATQSEPIMNPELHSENQVRTWLDDLRHQFDLAAQRAAQ